MNFQISLYVQQNPLELAAASGGEGSLNFVFCFGFRRLPTHLPAWEVL